LFSSTKLVIEQKYLYIFCNDWLYQTSDRGLY
jgi:hypothetical protein